MTMHEKTRIILDTAKEVLKEYNPMTVRQIYYQLVSRQVIKNDRSQYQAVSNLLVDARKNGEIPWNYIEDRLRRPRTVSMWDDLTDFSEAVKQSYQKNTWQTQADYLEVWLEKDALSGIFENVLEYYGVTLNVGRGYDGWDSIRNAANRFQDKNTTILYFGDFDPSGEDMVRSLKERLAFFDCYPEIIKCALTLEDITNYNLPPDFAKKSDTRAKKFIAKNGDICVELDALPAKVLETRLENEVTKRLDLKAFNEMKLEESNEIDSLVDYLQNL